MATTGLIKQLLEAGVHFGHQTRKWNPKMSKYIFDQRSGIYIIDLEKTAEALTQACDFLRSVAEKGEYVLFVGTKKQAQEAIQTEAYRCGMFFVNQRWLGGTLTNFFTIQKSVVRFKELQKMQESGKLDALIKKDAMQIKREIEKLANNLTGITDMDRLPGALFVVDSKKEEIAVKEARKLLIPVVGLVDTNCDPDTINFVIAGNDDAIRSIKLISSFIADAVSEGRRRFLEGQKAAGKVEKPLPQEEAVVEKKEPVVSAVEDESLVETEEEVVEKKIKKPDDFQMKMKKRPPRKVK